MADRCGGRVVSLSARILAETSVDTLAAGRSGGLVCAGPDVVVAPSAGGKRPLPFLPGLVGLICGRDTVLEDTRDRVTEIELGASLTGLAATRRWIWVTDDADGAVSGSGSGTGSAGPMAGSTDGLRRTDRRLSTLVDSERPSVTDSCRRIVFV